MQNTNDGGPAFPLPRNRNSGDAIYAVGDGLSLRDYFAAKALLRFMAHPKAPDIMRGDLDKLANDAYELADAMLRAREAK